MKIKLVVIGRTNKKFLIEGEEEYLRRLKRYAEIKYIRLNDVKNRKNKSEAIIKKEEGYLLMSKIKPTDFIILLDYKGK